jgi:hypothetical protein
MKMSDVFNLPVIDVVHDGYTAKQDKAAAHAINMHDKLVEALEGMIKTLEDNLSNPRIPHNAREAIKVQINNATDLLNKAKGLDK